MKLLSPSEKMLLLESKCVPETEATRISDLLKSKFRFPASRSNGNLIATYLKKIVVGENGEVDRGQEYIRRISKILETNTELVAKEIEKALQSSGVYEFKIPKDLVSKANELAKAIVDNGFSFAEFVEWLNATKSYKQDATQIMQDAGIKDERALYIQLMGQAANESADGENEIDTAWKWWREELSINEQTALLTKHDKWFNKLEAHKVASPHNKKMYPSKELVLDIWKKEVKKVDEASTFDNTILVNRPEDDITMFEIFEELIEYCEKKLKAGVDYDIVASGDIRIQPDVQDEKVAEFLELLKDYAEVDMAVAEAKNPLFNEERASELLSYGNDEDDLYQTVEEIVAAIVKHGAVAGQEHDMIDHIDGVTPIEAEEFEWTVSDFLNEIDYQGEYVHEARMTIKRPYKRGGVELAPAVRVAQDAKMRDKIIAFIGKQPLSRASKQSIFEFFNTMNEDSEIGRTPSKSWLYRNSHLVKRIQIGNSTFYKLTRAGQNLFKTLATPVNEEEAQTVTVGILDIDDVDRKWHILNSDGEPVGDDSYDDEESAKKAAKEFGFIVEAFSKDDVEEAINDFLQGSSETAKAIKSMPINSTTEGILTALHQLASEFGELSEPMVFGKLTPKQLDALHLKEEGVDESAVGDAAVIDWFNSLPKDQQEEIKKDFEAEKGVKLGSKLPPAFFNYLNAAEMELELGAEEIEMNEAKKNGSLVVEAPTKEQIQKFAALQSYLKKNYKADQYKLTASGALVISKSVLDAGNGTLTSVLEGLDTIDTTVKTGELEPKLQEYLDYIASQELFTTPKIAENGKSFAFETTKEVPHHMYNDKTEIAKYEVGLDGEEVYCLFVNNGDDVSLKDLQALKDYVG